MSFNALLLQSVAVELKEHLLGARVEKIHHPEKATIIIELRLPGKNLHLLLSAHPSFGRIYLTQEKYTNPHTPSAFCMLLRKHLEKYRLDDISSTPFERIVRLNFSREEDYGRSKIKKSLVLEIMGKHSNIILLSEEDVIIDALFRVDESKSRVRQILPQMAYTLPPPQKKENPKNLTPEKLGWFLEAANPKKSYDALVKNVAALSPDLAKQILDNVERPENHPEKVLEIILELVKLAEKGKFVPNTDGDSLIFYPPGRGRVNSVLDSYYSKLSTKDKLTQQKNNLLSFLQNHLNKNTKKLQLRNEALLNAQKANEYRKKGDLLTASLHLLKKGPSKVEIPDYYTEGQPLITIDTDPLLTPNQNAQNYYKRYNKARSALQNLDKLLVETEKEIKYLQEMIGLVDAAKDLDDLLSLKEELTGEGYLKERHLKRASKNKTNTSPLGPRRYLSPAGNEIMVGRNNKQNDTIRRQASKDFWWFHTQKLPGSHVILKTTNPTKEEVEIAATLAAIFSKGSEDTTVVVDSARLKHVRKPTGAKPGFVLYDNARSYLVKPDEALLRNLTDLNQEGT
ncbi:MAG: NFACT family protein [Firmicutes bacterium]|nr:NFACT family protein [Bacillota bacterium]